MLTDLEVYDVILNDAILPHRRVKDDWDITGSNYLGKIYTRS
jgi:hypothetical protein